MVDTKRQELVDFYFQKVQDKIKDLLKSDPKLVDEDLNKFNDLIFSQKEYDVRKDMEEYINDSVDGGVDVDIVAKAILDKYYDMVFLNDFNKDEVNDVENPMQEHKLLSYLEFVKENANSQQAYYIPYSSWFDMNKYDIDKITETIGLFVEPTSIWNENSKGWSNQPEVVCFLADSNLIPTIVEKLNVVFNTQWIRANQKDW